MKPESVSTKQERIAMLARLLARRVTDGVVRFKATLFRERICALKNRMPRIGHVRDCEG